MKSTEKSVLENTQAYTDQPNNSHYSNETEMIEVDNTPFKIIRTENIWFVIMGKWRMSEQLNSKEEALKNAQEITWNKIIQVLGVIVEETKNK